MPLHKGNSQGPPMAIDWCPKGCAAKGIGGCTDQFLECGCTMAMAIGGPGGIGVGAIGGAAMGLGGASP